jgi:predicted RNase H-like HicB family nuclease
MATYTILLDPDPEDGGYTVTVPALPGCVTEGETVVECIQNAEETIRLYRSIPKYRPQVVKIRTAAI